MIRAHVHDVLAVPERVVEDAIALLAEGAKLVAEGAGAVGVAALLAFPERFRGRRVATVVCGGNIDARILANVLLRGLLRDGRLLRLRLEIPDRPGVLADIAGRIAADGGNVIEVTHQRLFAAPSVQTAELEVMVEARDPVHAGLIAARWSCTTWCAASRRSQVGLGVGAASVRRWCAFHPHPALSRQREGDRCVGVEVGGERPVTPGRLLRTSPAPPPTGGTPRRRCALPAAAR